MSDIVDKKLIFAVDTFDLRINTLAGKNQLPAKSMSVHQQIPNMDEDLP